jgi:hypothetical protein
VTGRVPVSLAGRHKFIPPKGKKQKESDEEKESVNYISVINRDFNS